jgi:REP element-mobilizing transposase RayT
MPTKFIRKPNRLPFKEIYQGKHWYFVTICTMERKCIFVEEPLRFQNTDIKPLRFQNNNESHQFELNQLGKKVENLWQEIPQLFSGVILDEFVIMPNHIHAILGFEEKVYYQNSAKEQSLSDLIGKFKSILWTKVKHELNWNGEPSATIWQKSFYDHVIRDEEDLKRIREYIQNNPLKWQLDLLNPINKEKFEKWKTKSSSPSQTTS